MGGKQRPVAAQSTCVTISIAERQTQTGNCLGIIVRMHCRMEVVWAGVCCYIDIFRLVSNARLPSPLSWTRKPPSLGTASCSLMLCACLAKKRRKGASMHHMRYLLQLKIMFKFHTGKKCRPFPTLSTTMTAALQVVNCVLRVPKYSSW